MTNKRDENRKQQLQQIMDKTQELLDLIVNSDDYTQYQASFKELKESADLYERINEFRLKNLSLQLLGETQDNYDKFQKLYTEYKDILMEPMVSHFMLHEQSICKMLRKVQDRIVEGVDIDISYL